MGVCTPIFLHFSHSCFTASTSSKRSSNKIEDHTRREDLDDRMKSKHSSWVFAIDCQSNSSVRRDAQVLTRSHVTETYLLFPAYHIACIVHSQLRDVFFTSFIISQLRRMLSTITHGQHGMARSAAPATPRFVNTYNSISISLNLFRESTVQDR